LEAITLVCDICGKPAAETVTIKVGTRNHLKDLCSQHLGELLQGTRAPRRGRPKVSAPGHSEGAPASSSNGRRKRAGGKKTTRKARSAKSMKSGARRGRPPKKGQQSAK